MALAHSPCSRAHSFRHRAGRVIALTSLEVALALALLLLAAIFVYLR
jgi:hypothetical protein